MKLIEPIVQAAEEIKSLRRQIHSRPELAFEEVLTSDLVAQKLTEWGIPIHRGLGKTGIVGTIQGRPGKKAIGLRADMDALPMQEHNQFSHASQHQGKMHACGHDGHTAMLLGAAKHLAQHRDFDGTVYLVFQPAEEGGGGARVMIEDGIFEKFPMDAMFGAHNWPGIRAGQIGLAPGALMASSNEFYLTIKGKGTHAALPHLGVDPVMVAIQIAQSWQTIVTRNKNPIDTAVLSITQINAGTTTNVVPTTATMAGTLRTFAPHVTDLFDKRMLEIAQHTASAFDAEIELTFKRSYPATINDAVQAAFVAKVATEMTGADNVIYPIEPVMGAEDFSYFAQAVPSTYFFIGNGSGDHRDAGHGIGPCMLHNGSYDFNDDILPIGSSLWIHLVQAWFAQFGESK